MFFLHRQSTFLVCLTPKSIYIRESSLWDAHFYETFISKRLFSRLVSYWPFWGMSLLSLDNNTRLTEYWVKSEWTFPMKARQNLSSIFIIKSPPPNSFLMRSLHTSVNILLDNLKLVLLSIFQLLNTNFIIFVNLCMTLVSMIICNVSEFLYVSWVVVCHKGPSI